MIVGGQYEGEGRERMRYCRERFVEINMGEVRRGYYEGLDKVLEICGNLPQFRSNSFAI